ncbi:MAG: hypothetical protein ACRED9_15360 [Caulobacteraceae bacterium]
MRDIRSVLISNYEKRRAEYGVSVSRYFEGDPHGGAFVCDVSWSARFLNR